MSSKRQATQRNITSKKKVMQRQGDSSKSNKSSLKRGNGPPQRAPMSSARQQSTVQPDIRMKADGSSCRVIQRELIDILSSTASGFQLSSRWRVNPGSAKTFPWLSTMANSWETYRFHRLKFQVIARCPTTTAGSVIISPDYDAQDGVPLTETQMSQMKGTQEGAPWQDITLVLNPSAMNRSFKAHTTMDDSRFVVTTQDEKTIDAAQVFIANDCDSVIKIAKVWVDYDVELFTPQPPQLALDVGGGTFHIPTNSEQPRTTGGNYSNSPASTHVAQSLANPLFEVINNSINPSQNLVKMLRDWSGNMDWACNYSDTGLGDKFSQLPVLTKNGGILVPSGDARFPNALNGVDPDVGGTFSSVRNYAAVALKAGDIIGISNPVITGTLAAADTVLKFGGNLFPFV